MSEQGSRQRENDEEDQQTILENKGANHRRGDDDKRELSACLSGADGK